MQCGRRRGAPPPSLVSPLRLIPGNVTVLGSILHMCTTYWFPSVLPPKVQDSRILSVTTLRMKLQIPCFSPFLAQYSRYGQWYGTVCHDVWPSYGMVSLYPRILELGKTGSWQIPGCSFILSVDTYPFVQISIIMGRPRYFYRRSECNSSLEPAHSQY